MATRAVSENSTCEKQPLMFVLAIQAPLNLPVPHPHDRALLRPLSTLGKPKFSDSGVSFLRRTEYISSHQSKSRFDSTTSKSLINNTGGRFRNATVNVDKDSVDYVKEQVEKGFKTAASLVNDPSRVRHPSKRNIKLLSSTPLIPDLDAFPPDAGGYVSVKFLTNPVPSSSTYDIRLENSLLRPMVLSNAETRDRELAKEAYERDPERNPPPDSVVDYEFFLTETPEQALKFKRKFDVLDPGRDDESLVTNKTANGEPYFKFKRVRAYETATLTNVPDKYDDEVMIVVHDGTDGLRQKAAYYYPILQKMAIRPQRSKNINKNKMMYSTAQQTQEDLEEITDFIHLVVDDVTEELAESAARFKRNPLGEEPQEEADEENRAASGTSMSPIPTIEDEGAKSD